MLGKSGREILEALVGGVSDSAALAQLARGRLREKLPQLEQARAGQFGPHQRFLIAQQLAHIDFLDASLERVSAEIAERVRPFEVAVARVQSIPGVGRRTAEVLVAEVGVDLTRFPSARHLASWAGLCPGNCVQATMRARASAAVGARATAAPGCAPPWSKRARRRRAPRTPTSRLSSGAWRRDGAPNALLSRWRTACSSWSTRCSRSRPGIANLAATISMNGTGRPLNAASSIG
jgi:transposase